MKPKPTEIIDQQENETYETCQWKRSIDGRAKFVQSIFAIDPRTSFSTEEQSMVILEDRQQRCQVYMMDA